MDKLVGGRVLGGSIDWELEDLTTMRTTSGRTTSGRTTVGAGGNFPFCSRTEVVAISSEQRTKLATAMPHEGKAHCTSTSISTGAEYQEYY